MTAPFRPRRGPRAAARPYHAVSFRGAMPGAPCRAFAGSGVSMLTDDAVRYARLEAGARYLAAEARCLAEREEHLGMAEHYARRRDLAARWGRD